MKNYIKNISLKWLKLKEFWYFLIIVLTFLFNFKIVLASNFSENFDSYSTGQTAHTFSENWASTVDSDSIATTSQYYSSPNSLQVDNAYFVATSSDWQQISLKFYVSNNSSPTQFLTPYNQNDSSPFFHLFIDLDNTNKAGDIYLDFDGNTCDSVKHVIVATSTLANNTWHTLTIQNIRLNSASNSFFKFKINDLDWSEVYEQCSAQSRNSIDSIYFDSDVNNITYIDDLTLSDVAVEVIDISDWQSEVSVEAEDLIIQTPVYCIIGYTCNIWVNYSQDYIGYNLELYSLDFTLHDSTELIGGTFLKDYLTVNASTTEGLQEFIVRIESPTSTTTGKWVEVYWSLESPALVEFLSRYDCDTICDSISTSTDPSYWDNILYGMSCAGRKVTCWALVPDDRIIADFAQAVYEMNNVFPFSIYNQVQDVIINYDTATSTDNPTFDVLFPEWTGQNLAIASSTMMADTFGSTWTLIYSIMEKVVYISFFIYIILRGLNLARKKEPETV